MVDASLERAGTFLQFDGPKGQLEGDGSHPAADVHELIDLLEPGTQHAAKMELLAGRLSARGHSGACKNHNMTSGHRRSGSEKCDDRY